MSRAFAIAVALLALAFAAAPAYADDIAPPAQPGDGAGAAPPTGSTDPNGAADPFLNGSGPGAETPKPVDPGASSTPPAPPTDTTPPAETPATTDPATDGTGGGSAADPSNGGGSSDHKQPAHDGGQSDSSFSAAGAPSPPTTGASPTDGLATSDPAITGPGYTGTWSGQDNFLIASGPSGSDPGDGPPGIYRGPLAGLLAIGHVSRATRLEAAKRQAHQTAKVSPIGGSRTPGGPPPGQNPFFDLLHGPGGAPASVLLLGMFAVLGAAIALLRDPTQKLRIPTVRWRPLAYVPPIELPG